jgi:hypothetical protein
VSATGGRVSVWKDCLFIHFEAGENPGQSILESKEKGNKKEKK